MKIDAIILAALPKERQAILEAIKETNGSLTEYRADGRDYAIAQVGPLTLAIPQPMGMGVTHAALATADALADLSAKAVVLSGIAGCMADQPVGGNPARFLLGDIVVSDLIIDYTLEKDKETVEKDTGGGESRIRLLQPRPLPFPSSDALVKAARTRQLLIRGGHPDRYADQTWKDPILLTPPVKLPDTYRPAVHIGSVLSGNSVMASLEGKRKLLERVSGFNPPPIAIEMEAAGIVRRLVREQARRRPEFIMIKSLCDWAEGAKVDDWQDYCSHIAALYTLHLLREEASRLFQKNHLDPQEPEAELHTRTEAAVKCYTASLGIQSVVLRETAEAVRASAVNEIIDMADGHYKADLGTSEQFLLRAEPFFRNAKEIYATSLDTVSTFWTDPDNRDDALRYIKCQEGKGRKVVRLFVFSTPENAHRHGKVLDANLAAYDNVFVCSMAHYRELLQSTIAPKHIETYTKRDFALLDYADGTSCLAELDHRLLRLDPLQVQGKSVRSRPTRDLFNDLVQSIRPGVFDRKRKVLRWADAYWERHQKWAADLDSMFEKPKADVFHTVSFDITEKQYEDLRSDLAKIKYQLLQGNGRGRPLGDLYHIKNIWLTQRVVYNESSSPHDGLTNGRLRMSASKSRRYMLMIQFGSVADLEGYYRDRDHAELRRELYQKLDPRTKSLLDRLEEIRKQNDPDDRVDEQYEIIEDLAAHKIHRLDFFEDELIEHMVMSAPYDF